MTEPAKPLRPWVKAAHLVFWTALFYLLAVGVAKLAEWASG